MNNYSSFVVQQTLINTSSMRADNDEQLFQFVVQALITISSIRADNDELFQFVVQQALITRSSIRADNDFTHVNLAESITE